MFKKREIKNGGKSPTCRIIAITTEEVMDKMKKSLDKGEDNGICPESKRK